jgi:hypothetical protein
MLVVGALTTAVCSRSTVELDAGARVVETVVGATVVVVARVVGLAVVRGAAVVSGALVVVGAMVVLGATVVGLDVVVNVVVVAAVVVVARVVDVELVDAVVLVVEVLLANAGPLHRTVDASTSTPNPVRVRLLGRRGGRITAFLIRLKR